MILCYAVSSPYVTNANRQICCAVPRVFINLSPYPILLWDWPQLPVMTSQIILKIKATNITIKNVNTCPVSKISNYLNPVIFDKHKLPLSHKISNTLLIWYCVMLCLVHKTDANRQISNPNLYPSLSSRKLF